MHSFYLGLDLGQAADYTALAILEEPIWSTVADAWVSSAMLPREVRESGLWERWQVHAPGLPPLWLRGLRRYPLRTPYPDIVADVIRRLGGGAPRDDAVLVVDATGVGAAVIDMFRFSDLPCKMIRVLIHGGNKVTQDYGLGVPKRDLIGAVQVAIQTRRLQPSQHTTEVDTFLAEMENYKMTISEKTGHDSYDARGDSKHDDLVLAASLACWYRARLNRGE